MSPEDPTAAASRWNRERPYPARLNTLARLTTAASAKDVRHVEIDLGDSGIDYVPGDTLGIWVSNDPALVEEVLRVCGLSGTESVMVDDHATPLRQALTMAVELTQVHPGFLKHLAAVNPAPALAALVGNPASMRQYLDQRQIIEVLLDYPANLSADALMGCLRRMTPRQYSIASSPLRDPHRIDLTVNVVRYESATGERKGAGSAYLGERSAPGDQLLVYVVPNPNFRLPADSDATILMIGPGTGIAPFRAFLQHRELSGARGRNLLYFGNPHRASDFLYENELLDWHARGVLDQLHLAFSRDQPEKRYVQHLLLEQARDVFAALEEGAHIYVCGDAKHMAEDVQRTLLNIIETEGGMEPAAARQYLVAMRQSHRYQRDVY